MLIGSIRLPEDNCTSEISSEGLAESDFSDYNEGMEQELRNHLTSCVVAFADARKLGIPTIGRLAAGDWRFFDRLNDDDKTFTARKYDEVIAWFSANWPDATPWPADVPRGAPSEPERAA